MNFDQKQRKILYLVTQDDYFVSHRLSLGIAALKAGYEVVVAGAQSKAHAKINAAGMRFMPLTHLNRSGMNPFKEILALWELIRLYTREKPCIVHHVAMKPVLLGSIAAYFTKIPRVINALGGLGYLFISQKIKTQMIRAFLSPFMRFLFTRPGTTLVLQNTDDIKTLKRYGYTLKADVALVRGSGVNTTDFPETPLPPIGVNGPIVTFVARLLWDKGVSELAQATVLLQKYGVHALYKVYGDIDPDNPASLTSMDVDELEASTPLMFLGHTDHPETVYQQCHIAVLPSYREGLPKSLLEAASCGRAIVATDVPGCREVVTNNINGLLVPSHNPEALAKALQTLINDPGLCQKMGHASRQKVMTEFHEDLICQQILDVYEKHP